MSNDRELLEKASKAAGLQILRWWCDVAVLYDPRTHEEGATWNPLIHDGDALRLAVKLDLTLRCYSGNTCAQTTTPGGPSVYVDETDHHDPYAATRRAIVRAAAEIGRSMA